MTKGSSQLFEIILIISLCFSLCTCGLEVYEENMLYAPRDSDYRAGEPDPSFRTFIFTTSEDHKDSYLEYPNNENVYLNFQGTKVFYRIYNSLTALNSDRYSIESVNAEFSSAGANRAITLGFKEISKFTPKTSKVSYFKVANSDKDKNVEIRVYPEAEYQVGFFLGKEPMCDYENNIIVPYRSLGSAQKDFNFFEDTDKNPKKEDEDVNFSENSDVTEGAWYIAAYAASYAINVSFNNVYSQLLDLGYIKIEE